MGDDLISRQAAINTSLEFFVEFLGGALHENAQKELIARFQRLSSAQPERKMQCNFCSMSICTLEGRPCSRQVVKE